MPKNTSIPVKLGPLEKSVMCLLWQQSPRTVREVFTILEQEREIAYTTVLTIMQRLVEKKFLCCEKQGKTLFFSVCTPKIAMARAATDSFFVNLFDTYDIDGMHALKESFQDLDEVQQKKLLQVLLDDAEKK